MSPAHLYYIRCKRDSAIYMHGHEDEVLSHDSVLYSLIF
jgi:hypothetical protein